LCYLKKTKKFYLYDVYKTNNNLFVFVSSDFIKFGMVSNFDRIRHEMPIHIIWPMADRDLSSWEGDWGDDLAPIEVREPCFLGDRGTRTDDDHYVTPLKVLIREHRDNRVRIYESVGDRITIGRLPRNDCERRKLADLLSRSHDDPIVRHGTDWDVEINENAPTPPASPELAAIRGPMLDPRILFGGGNGIRRSADGNPRNTVRDVLQDLIPFL